VAKVIAVLRKYEIPFLLEASGSSESYHIWIFLAPTRTINAFDFIRQINAEAGVECEAWPKQKSLAKGKYGNLVKLPICVNQRSGARSVFLDPGSFEILAKPIPHPGLVQLYEVPRNTVMGMPKVGKAPRDIGGSLAYCMTRALEEKVPLIGADGHNMRFAIAVKARHIGMTVEEAAELFQDQANYNYEISLSKAEEAWSYDNPWSCETLQDKCGQIVKKYCSTCPYGRPFGGNSNHAAA
jgi:hypothetical protein